MTRAEIEGYLLHAKASPETFVLDEQADLLEAEFSRLAARVAELEDEVAKLRALAKRSEYAPGHAKADNP